MSSCTIGNGNGNGCLTTTIGPRLHTYARPALSPQHHRCVLVGRAVQAWCLLYRVTWGTCTCVAAPRVSLPNKSYVRIHRALGFSSARLLAGVRCAPPAPRTHSTRTAVIIYVARSWDSNECRLRRGCGLICVYRSRVLLCRPQTACCTKRSVGGVGATACGVA